jgi:hypothetical protein
MAVDWPSITEYNVTIFIGEHSTKRACTSFAIKETIATGQKFSRENVLHDGGKRETLIRSSRPEKFLEVDIDSG